VELPGPGSSAGSFPSKNGWRGEFDKSAIVGNYQNMSAALTNYWQDFRVCFKNRKRADFLGNLIGLVDRKARENEMSY
jgi:hypothetical protein